MGLDLDQEQGGMAFWLVLVTYHYKSRQDEYRLILQHMRLPTTYDQTKLLNNLANTSLLLAG